MNKDNKNTETIVDEILSETKKGDDTKVKSEKKYDPACKRKTDPYSNGTKICKPR